MRGTRDADDKRKTSTRMNEYRTWQYLLCLIPLAYVLAGMGAFLPLGLPGGWFLPGGTSSHLTLPPGVGFGAIADTRRPVVPLPKTGRTVIRFYDGNTVITYDHKQPGQDANWWTVVNANVWEADTLGMIRYMLTRRPNSVYIDFGAWVGPTAIFASSYARKVYAMEPDPGAFNELYYNVVMNPHISRNTEVFQLCISDGPGVLEMHGELGSSMPTLLDYPGAAEHRANNNTAYADFKVECLSLEQFMQGHNINPNEVALIKMDTEGAEIKILPQLKPFIAKYKPNILLSLHAFLFKTNTAAHAAIKEVVAMYQHPVWLDGSPVDKQNLDVANTCHLCAMLLTDVTISGEDLRAAQQKP